jgi:HAD superfamily hydrolase (TIGR01509 family)
MSPRATTRFIAVVFDMDGVLIDSERVIRHAAQRAAVEIDRVLTDAFYMQVMGLPGAQVEAAFMREFGRDFPLADYRQRFERHYKAQLGEGGIQPKPGVPQLLQSLVRHNIPVAVATATRSGNAETALRAAGLLDHLPICVTGDQVAQGKPAPDIFLAAASRLGISAAQCIAVEDSEVGARAAVAAGMRTLMVPDFRPPGDELRALVHEVLESMPHAAQRIHTLLGLDPA